MSSYNDVLMKFSTQHSKTRAFDDLLKIEKYKHTSLFGFIKHHYWRTFTHVCKKKSTLIVNVFVMSLRLNVALIIDIVCISNGDIN